MLICMDKVSYAADRRVIIAEAAACAALSISTLENAHPVSESAVSAEHGLCAYARREVRCIRLEASRLQRLIERLSFSQSIINGVCLVAVGNDQVVFEGPDRRIDYEARILELRNIERFREHSPVSLNKYAVSRIDGPSHNKICDDSFGAIAGLSGHDAAAGISVSLDRITEFPDFINVHVSPLLSCGRSLPPLPAE